MLVLIFFQYRMLIFYLSNRQALALDHTSLISFTNQLTLFQVMVNLLNLLINKFLLIFMEESLIFLLPILVVQQNCLLEKLVKELRAQQLYILLTICQSKSHSSNFPKSVKEPYNILRQCMRHFFISFKVFQPIQNRIF